MAIYHLSVKVLSRSQGQSAIFAAAYRAGERLKDERRNEVKDYSRRHRLLYKEILYPSETPGWLVADRQTLWNAVEASEKRPDSQVAREIEISLPAELNLEQQIELVKEYVQEQFVKLGMIADITINNPPKTHEGKPRNSDPRNVYAQILLTTRNVNSDGFGQKNRQWNHKNLVERWRTQWEIHANSALREAGKQERIDHRSLKAQGLQQSLDKKSSKSSQKTKKTDYKIIPIRQEFEFLVKAYAVWLKSQQIERQSDDFKNFKDRFKKEFENQPKNQRSYREWAKSISQIQNEFLEQLIFSDD